MPVEVTVKEVNRGRNVTLEFTITNNPKGKENPFWCGAYNINDTAEVWFHFDSENVGAFQELYTVQTSISMKKHESALDSIVKLNVACEVMNYSKQFSCPQELSHGTEICEVEVPFTENYSLKVDLIVSKKERITFATLYDDTDLTDFHLSTDEGSVAVHRACLALHSDMFKTMLLGKWKETKEGCVELKGISLQTLQHLKDYIYLGTLPDDVRPLLVLAKCYLLDNLKEDCLMKLARSVRPGNLYELQEFACENNVVELSHMLLQLATNDIIQAANLVKKPSPSDPSDPSVEVEKESEK